VDGTTAPGNSRTTRYEKLAQVLHLDSIFDELGLLRTTMMSSTNAEKLHSLAIKYKTK
jgi:hypothetical protein